MIVKCRKIYNAVKRTHQEKSDYISIGKHYVVIGIEFYDDVIYYRVFPDYDVGFTSTPILVRSDDFDVVSGKMPATWVLQRFAGTASVLGPERWVKREYWESDFWNDWIERKPKAVECFHEEYALIQAVDEKKETKNPIAFASSKSKSIMSKLGLLFYLLFMLAVLKTVFIG